MATEDLVEVFRGNKLEANAIVGALRSMGMDVVESSDDMGGMRPEVGHTQGYRLLVRASDAPDARRVITGIDQ